MSSPIIARLGIGSPLPDRSNQFKDRFVVQQHPWPLGDFKLLQPASVILLECSETHLVDAADWCRRYRSILNEPYQPIVWILPRHTPEWVQMALDAGADVCLASPVPLELLASQLHALLRSRPVWDRLRSRADDAARINAQLQQAYRQMDQDLELTRRIQRTFGPRITAKLGNCQFALCHRPRSRVGGDFFEQIRLDEQHVALCLGDALGRSGAAGSLLGIFVKTTLQTKEIVGRSYRLIPPDEILRRVNRELLSLGMLEPPLVTMLYAQLNIHDGRIDFARAGQPAPLLIPKDGSLAYWTHGGMFLGMGENRYPTKTAQLRAGDKLLLVSDGIHQSEDQPDSGGRLMEVAEQCRHLPIQAFVDQVAHGLLQSNQLVDDVTLVGVEFAPQSAASSNSASTPAGQATDAR
ncbi:PP2C family protein-serine/threonine phosphatase [Tuwongella immobilis]|uniref:PPM-type phosphatase domain-containing protein n=1 Tax=Tuwongella immobilis TaxID=692036 RepID=A0A6C2YLU8_9BACT|nr:PP2C family protein-serine/threonine phosphatase [Tuwongella immobilis]VIP02337.1 chemotaxis protein : Serine phosphatase RsbU, regulator of sigma subunit OS=Salipiger mucosus DSM 16094 GN=Salmuc_05204 PE=4 SV=1: SpoIIE [Tuwongella immobilis]VTS01097.1 chemotaxis protein : Serine phosphatase RsbU, regulator of sigma subunit OS=Salipiger mucosus DSM 16094 GN=Salmuc_05204 PE=4 SV=1: SpoIIE [Tuwongella immobilis]